VKVSILIPTRDRPEKLERAVRLALAQTYADIEIVVQDASTDTRDPRLPDDPRVFYIREPDTGIPNGLNRAAALARGDVLHFCCDDDAMFPDAVDDALTAFAQGYQWTAGRIDAVTPGEPNRPHGGERWRVSTLLIGNVIPQPATFFTRCIFDEAGGFDESLALCIDYELWGRFARCYPPLIRQHIDSTYHRWVGSTSVMDPDAVEAEAELIRARWRAHGIGWRP
jgi:glycosyltransferase involved in cell wall biosynthesis